MKTALLIISLCLAVVAFSQQKQLPTKPDRVLTVTGNADVFASPDEATVRLGVVKTAKTAADAQNQANAVIQKVLVEIRKLGIAKENVQTSQMNLNPSYNEPKPGQTPEIVEYRAEDILSIRVSDFSLIGKVIDASTASGANSVQSIAFSLRNDREPRSRAYREAVQDARSKADSIAEALGMRVSDVLDVSADTNSLPPLPRSMGFAGKAMANTPIEPGQARVSVSVTIRYRLD